MTVISVKVCHLIPVINSSFIVSMSYLTEVDRARILAELESGRSVRDLAGLHLNIKNIKLSYLTCLSINCPICHYILNSQSRIRNKL